MYRQKIIYICREMISNEQPESMGEDEIYKPPHTAWAEKPNYWKDLDYSLIWNCIGKEALGRWGDTNKLEHLFVTILPCE